VSAAPDARVLLAFTVSLPASPARVFAAVTEGRHLERWFCDACESEPEDGGRLTMRWHRRRSQLWPYEATWTVFDEPHRCTCRGGHEGYPNRDAGEITFVVNAGAPGSVLEVHHTLPDSSEYEPFVRDFREAWPRALQRLEAYLSPAGVSAARGLPPTTDPS
jgi:uncharacterized protein YndB with AHSA1/START domain